jgi:hypothetical protein
MGFRTGAYAKVWTVEDKGNVTKVKLSTSKKNKQTDAYETDFSGFVNFVGTAHKAASNLKDGDRIKIGDCDVTSSYNAEKKITYTNYAIFSYEDANGNSSEKTEKSTTPKSTSKKKEVEEDDYSGDGLPF